MIGNRPWEIVTEPDYFRNVMGTMVTAGLGRKADLWVRFGKLGTGQKPNYQVHSPDGRVIRYSGTSHKVFHENSYVSFEPENISDEVFTYPDVVKLLARCLTNTAA